MVPEKVQSILPFVSFLFIYKYVFLNDLVTTAFDLIFFPLKSFANISYEIKIIKGYKLGSILLTYLETK